MVVIWVLVDLYFFQAIRTVTANLNPLTRSSIHWGYWILEGGFLLLVLYLAVGARVSFWSKDFGWMLGLMILSMVPKLIVVPLFLIEDVGRFFAAVYNWFSNTVGSTQDAPVDVFVARRKFVSQLALGIAAVPFAGILHGLFRGKYSFQVRRADLSFRDLPDAFDGFRITQLSDIHAGSFTDVEAAVRGLALANEQESDLILFTGDIVNNEARELEPWFDALAGLKAPHGKYSVLGNHDYGDYKHWEFPGAKEDNLRQLKDMQREAGFRLLLNEHVEIEKDGERICLLGVENWGLRGFHQYGDLNKTLANVDDSQFKILLSHDPSHWEAETIKHAKHIHLTLSGHTHGMQFGVEVPGFKWSPIQYIYKQWAGAYAIGVKKLYVNRGYGFLAFPGRVGIMPEITVITLRKA